MITMKEINLFELYFADGRKVVIEGYYDWDYDSFFKCKEWNYITGSLGSSTYGWKESGDIWINPKHIIMVRHKIDPKIYIPKD